VSDKLCYAKTTNSGAWSFELIDVSEDFFPMTTQSQGIDDSIT